MVSKCANPECSVPFHYFREGKLFQVDTTSSGLRPSGPQLMGGKMMYRVEHFWLCGVCSASLTLSYHPAKGVFTVPIPAVRRAAAS
jgi:hypothetical protein